MSLRHRKKVTCPYCLHEHPDTGDFDCDADCEEFECHKCEKVFYLTAEVEITWATAKIEGRN